MTKEHAKLPSMLRVNDDCTIGLDKSGYQENSFLISRRKHMLWVLIRSAWLKKVPYQELCSVLILE